MPKPELSLYELDEERALPWGDPGLYAWHLARYEFAAAFAEGGRVLDAGSGEGYGTALLAKHAREAVGVDYSPAAVEHARSAYPAGNLRFEVADVTRLDPQLGSFDLITCFEVIEHIEDDDRLLAGIARLLNPGGVLVLSTPNAVLDAAVRGSNASAEYEYHVNMLGPRELGKRVRRHFRSVQVYGQSLRGNRLHAALKALDVLNLRHRLVRSRDLQRRVAERSMGPTPARRLTHADFRFSRAVVRQAGHLVVTAVR